MRCRAFIGFIRELPYQQAKAVTAHCGGFCRIRGLYMTEFERKLMQLTPEESRELSAAMNAGYNKAAAEREKAAEKQAKEQQGQ